MINCLIVYLLTANRDLLLGSWVGSVHVNIDLLRIKRYLKFSFPLWHVVF